MRFNGAPSKRRIASDQPTLKPQFDGLSRAMATPRAASRSTQLASEPSRGQLAPPSASTVTSAAMAASRSPCAKRSRPAPSQPSQRWRKAKRAPNASSRRSQARSSGEAFIALGNTRPLEPTKVS